MGGHRRSNRRQQKPAAAAGEVAAQQQRAAKSSHGLRPDLGVVMRAIDSLYEDQLKPFGRILRKRLAERASGAPIARLYVPPGMEAVPLPEVDVTHLRSVCEACAELRIQPEEGGDWSAVVVGRPEDFVDVYSLDDTYSPEFWARAEAYFASIVSPGMCLPGGRYACAQALASRGLDFFDGSSLGQICHVVQLAITQRKVLGYCNGAVVPYSESQSMMKEQCAEQQQPCASSDAAAMPLASWEVARVYLREILQAAAPGDGGAAMVPLSNVKRLFRSRYSTELSETMLGHSRLSDLMQDEHFHDLCSLELQKSGYVVVQRQPPACTRISLADILPSPGGEALLSHGAGLQLGGPRDGSGSPCQRPVEPRPFCVDEPLAFDDLTGEAAFLSQSTPLPSPGVPASATVKHWLGEPHRLAFLPDEFEPLSDQSPSGEPLRVAFCPDEPLCLEDAAPGLEGAPLSLRTPLPSPGQPPSATVRKWGGLADFLGGGVVQPSGARQQPARGAPENAASSDSGESWSATSHRWSDAPQRVEFCPDEPLCLEEVRPGVFDAPTPLSSPGVPGSATVRRWAGEPHRLEFFPERLAAAQGAAAGLPERRRSPGEVHPAAEGRVEPLAQAAAPGAGLPSLAFALSALSSSGGLVQNTFIHAKLPPPTPLLTRRRAHSAPRDMGTRQSEPAEAAPCPGTPTVAAPPSALQRALAGLEPLEDPSPAAGPSPVAAAATPRWLAVSPVDKCVRLTVRNTFIHSAPTPCTCLAGSARRSQSTPPDLSLCRGAAEALGQALRVLPRLLNGIDGKHDHAMTPGSCKSPDAGLPAFVPLSPALTASPTDRGCGWLGAGGPPVGMQRVVRLADYV